MKQWFPQSLKARAVWILCGLMLVSHTASLFLFEASRERAVISTEARDLADRIAGIVDLAGAFPAEDRQRILAAAQTQFLVMFPPSEALDDVACQDSETSRTLSDVIDEEFRRLPGLDAEVCVRSLGTASLAGGGNLRGFDVLVHIYFADQTETLFHAILPAAAPLLQDNVLIYLLGVALLSIAFAWYLIRKALDPLQNLAIAADKLGVNIDAPRLPEDGPREVSMAASAFNRMQARLARLVHGQTEMLAAISHDLRSALTRLWLRVELLEEGQQKDGLLRVLKDMQVMVESVLAFSRGVSPHEKSQRIDLNELVENLCRDQREEGLKVRWTTSHSPSWLVARPASLRRAVFNLIDNAVKYGGTADVSVAEEAGYFVIQVLDQGPGIPEDRLESVKAPFYRLDQSRNQETRGMGLGLAIAQNIAQAHGGDIRLSNMPEDGLRADMILPAGPRADEGH